MDKIAILEMLSPSRLVPPSCVLTFLHPVRQYLLLFLVLLHQLLEVAFDTIELDPLSSGQRFANASGFPSRLIWCLDDEPFLVSTND